MLKNIINSKRQKYYRKKYFCTNKRKNIDTHETMVYNKDAH